MTVDPSDRDVPSFVGRGLPFPLRVDESGSIATTSGTEDIDKAMVVILSTAIGERPMRPAFGCGIWDLLFEPLTPNTLGLMEEAVRVALARWEPRADVRRVTVVPDPGHLGSTTINIDYVVRATNDERNLVHPFYTIPGEGAEEPGA